jgi:hypothetical protein
VCVRNPAPNNLAPFVDRQTVPTPCELPRMGFCVCASSLRKTIGMLKRRSGGFVSARKIPFPGNGRLGFAEFRFASGSLSRKAKHLVLLGPFGGQVGEAGNAHTMRKSTVNRRFDEIGREERKRDRHIDLADAAPLAFRNCFGGSYPVSCKFIEPTASAGDSGD